MVKHIDWHQYVRNEFITEDFLSKLWDKERREDALRNLREKLNRVETDPVLKEINHELYDRISTISNKSLQKFDEYNVCDRISALELWSFRGLCALS